MPVALLLAATFAVAQSTAPAWHTDYAKAQSEASKTGKPILAVLH